MRLTAWKTMTIKVTRYLSIYGSSHNCRLSWIEIDILKYIFDPYYICSSLVMVYNIPLGTSLIFTYTHNRYSYSPIPHSPFILRSASPGTCNPSPSSPPLRPSETQYAGPPQSNLLRLNFLDRRPLLFPAPPPTQPSPPLPQLPQKTPPRHTGQ